MTREDTERWRRRSRRSQGTNDDGDDRHVCCSQRAQRESQSTSGFASCTTLPVSQPCLGRSSERVYTLNLPTSTRNQPNTPTHPQIPSPHPSHWSVSSSAEYLPNISQGPSSPANPGAFPAGSRRHRLLILATVAPDPVLSLLEEDGFSHANILAPVVWGTRKVNHVGGTASLTVSILRT